jgi:hypothetical protein
MLLSLALWLRLGFIAIAILAARSRLLLRLRSLWICFICRLRLFDFHGTGFGIKIDSFVSLVDVEDVATLVDENLINHLDKLLELVEGYLTVLDAQGVDVLVDRVLANQAYGKNSED